MPSLGSALHEDDAGRTRRERRPSGRQPLTEEFPRHATTAPQGCRAGAVANGVNVAKKKKRGLRNAPEAPFSLPRHGGPGAALPRHAVSLPRPDLVRRSGEIVSRPDGVQQAVLGLAEHLVQAVNGSCARLPCCHGMHPPPSPRRHRAPSSQTMRRAVPRPRPCLERP